MAKEDNLYSKAISFWQLGNFEQAKKTFKKLLKNNFPNAQVLSFIGILDIQMGNLNEGVASLKKAYLIDPTNINIKKNYANALVDLSNFQIEHNQISQALISLENSIDAFPDNEPAYMNLIKINIKQKNYLKVDEIFNAALDYLSNNSNLYFLYGNSLFDQKKYKEALSMYEKTLEIDKHFAESYFHQALCYEFLGDIETSLSKYDSCLNIKPGYELALYNKAQLLLALGNFEEGWNLYQNRWSSKRNIGKYFFNQTTELKDIDSARNKNIFVWAEQGIGDQILYSSLLYDFKKLAPNLTVSIDKRLLKIYQKLIT
jgi:tetratricopeptide (TPR) repeat protein